MTTETNTGGQTGGEATTTTTTTATPSFRDSMPAEYQTDPVFKNFNSVEDVLKSYKSAAGMVGLDKGEVARKPSSSAPAAEWDAFYNFLGRPESEAKYTVPETGKTLPQEKLSSLKKTAHSLGLNDKQFAAWVESETQAEAASAQQREQMFAQGYEDGKAALTKEWGAAYEQNVRIMAQAVKDVGGQRLVDILNNSGLINLPEVAKAFHKLGTMTQEDGAAGASGSGGHDRPMTPKAAELEWNTLKGDKNFMANILKGDKAAIAQKDRLFGYMYPEERRA